MTRDSHACVQGDNTADAMHLAQHAATYMRNLLGPEAAPVLGSLDGTGWTIPPSWAAVYGRQRLVY
jgi:hypothetical protein